MPMLVAGLLLLWLSSYLLRGFVRANPTVLSRRLRKMGGWVAIGFGLFMLLRGELNLAVGAGMVGLWLLGTQPGWANGFFGAGARRGFGGVGPRRQASRVGTATLDMVLDPATGRIAGRCLQGPFGGRLLDDLSEAECVALHGWCNAADPQGARLLETYLDRRFARWREAGQAAGDPGRDRWDARSREPSAGMSEREAHEMLGLPEGASKEDITRAHRRLMMKFHPDQGGTTAMAARINEAKDVLMRRHA